MFLPRSQKLSSTLIKLDLLFIYVRKTICAKIVANITGFKSTNKKCKTVPDFENKNKTNIARSSQQAIFDTRWDTFACF